MGNSFTTLTQTTPVKYGPGINKLFSMPGYPTSYIQVNEIGLKDCLANNTDPNVINSCINQNIFAPSTNNIPGGVTYWSGEQLPSNPACITNLQNTKEQPTILFAPKMSPEVSAIYDHLQNNMQHFQNMDSFDTSDLLKQNNMTLIIVIIITLLIVTLK
jgi:hypothetical protein